MKHFKLFLKCLTPVLCDKTQFQEIFKNKSSKSVSQIINNRSLHPQSQRATVFLPALLNRSTTTTPQSKKLSWSLASATSGQLASSLVGFQRCVSSQSDKDKDSLLCLSELQSLLKKGNCVLIDVRSERETWITGVIPGSLCVPLDKLETALKMSPEQFLEKYCRKKPSTDDHIIVICLRGGRSFKATKIAKKMGYENVQSVQGGFLRWLDRQRLIREHQDKNKESDYER